MATITKANCLFPYFQLYHAAKSTDPNLAKFPVTKEMIEKNGEIILQIYKEPKLKVSNTINYLELSATDSRNIFTIVLITNNSTSLNISEKDIFKLTSFLFMSKGYIQAQLQGYEHLRHAPEIIGSSIAPIEFQKYGNAPKVSGKTLPLNKPSTSKSSTNTSIISSVLLDHSITRISELNSSSTNWTIEAAVRVKFPIKKWSKGASSEGTLIGMELVDSEGGEIKATAFNDVCTTMDQEIQQGKTYRFSGGIVKLVANTAFNKLSHSCEITFTNLTKIHESSTTIEASNVYHPTPIQEISNLNDKQSVDVIAVVWEVQDTTEFTPKNKDRSTKRKNITILDDSKSAINATFWGASVDKLENTIKQGDVIAIKGATVSNFNKKSLSCGDSTRYDINPTSMDKYGQLQSWYRSNKASLQESFQNMNLSSNFTGGQSTKQEADINQLLDFTVEDAKGLAEAKTILVVNGYLSRMMYNNTNTDAPKKCYYLACSACKKSRGDDPDHCTNEQCTNKTSSSNPCYKLILKLSDDTGSIAVEVLGANGEKIMGIPPIEFDEKTPEQQQLYIQEKFSPMLVVNVKPSVYNDKIRFNIISCFEPNYNELIEKENSLLNTFSFLINTVQAQTQTEQ